MRPYREEFANRPALRECGGRSTACTGTQSQGPELYRARVPSSLIENRYTLLDGVLQGAGSEWFSIYG